MRWGEVQVTREQRSPFLRRLKEGPILADGAMGTMIYSKGISFDQCFDELNLSRPGLIGSIHDAYLAAGAELLETNTFGASRVRLAEYELADKVAEINMAAVRIAQEAREARGVEAFIAGSIGPTGKRLQPYGPLAPAQAEAAFREQAEALITAGVDLIILETFSFLDEILVALRAVRALGDIPVIAEMTFDEEGRTLSGHTPVVVARALVEAGADVVGANCGTGPSGVLSVIEEMVRADLGVPLSAMPNAGFPARVGQRLMYPSSPAYFAEFARRFQELGVAVIGGCCGTTPAHIAAMAEAIRGKPAKGATSFHITVAGWKEAVLPAEEEALPATELEQKLGRQAVITVEMSPPRGYRPDKMLEAARRLKEAGVDAINVADNPMARMRMSAWAAAFLVQARVGLDTILHFPVRGRNLLRVQSDLLAVHALGIRHVFVVMGDPTRIGDYPDAADTYDVTPSGLVRLIKEGFNQGQDQAGQPIGQPTRFVVGAALNMGAEDLRREIKVMRRKLDAGADFFLTQPVYDVETVERFLDQAGEVGAPILMGVLPLRSLRHALFLHNEVPGIQIPDRLLQRMEEAGPNALDEGIRIAQELVVACRPYVQGFYIIPPFGRYEVVAPIVHVLGDRELTS